MATATATVSSNMAAGPSEGLVNQGWKDSHDSIFHADGALARGPIALAEVQAYVYGAWRAAAPTWRARSDLRARARPGGTRRRPCARRFDEPFSTRRWAAMCWRSTARKSPAGSAPRTPATPCSPASPCRNAPAAVVATLMDRDVLFRLGRAHDRHDGEPLQSDELSQRLDLAARQCARSPPASRATAFAARPRASSRASTLRRPISIFAACRNCSAASRASATRGRPSIRSPARRRPGRRRRLVAAAILPRAELRHPGGRDHFRPPGAAAVSRSRPAARRLSVGTDRSMSRFSATAVKSSSRCCRGRRRAGDLDELTVF